MFYGVWLDPSNDDLYLTTKGTFAVAGLNGDADDIFTFTPNTTGSSTSGSFSAFWNGDKNGFVNERLDGLFIEEAGEEPCTTGSFDNETKLTAFDGAPDDYFGYSVTILEDTMVVTATGDNDNGDSSGSAYIYERHNCGNWLFAKKIVASDGEASFRFGQSVALSGDTIVIGGFYFYDATRSKGQGAAYIYERNEGGNNNWGEVKKISDNAATEAFADSVAISGDTIVIGDSFYNFSADIRGSIHVYERNTGGNNNWGEIKRVIAFDEELNDRFGRFVAISGNTIVVGASDHYPGDYSRNLSYIYERDEGGIDSWGQVKKLLGSFIAISQDTIVAGGPYYDATDEDLGSPNPALIYQRNNNSWEKIKEIAPSNNNNPFFGLFVAISGDSILVGSPLTVFKRDNGGSNNWGEFKNLQTNDPNHDHDPGFYHGNPPVAISGGTIIVGDSGDNAKVGSVYIYE